MILLKVPVILGTFDGLMLVLSTSSGHDISIIVILVSEESDGPGSWNQSLSSIVLGLWLLSAQVSQVAESSFSFC